MLHANNRKDSEVIPSGSFQESIFRSPASSCSQKGCPSWKIKGSGVPRSMPSKVWLLPLAIFWFKLGCPFSSLLKCTDYLLGWDFEQRPIIRVASEWPPSGCNSWTTVLTNRRKKSISQMKILCLSTFEWGFPGSTSGEESSCQCRARETQVRSPGWRIPLE